MSLVRPGGGRRATCGHDGTPPLVGARGSRSPSWAGALRQGRRHPPHTSAILFSPAYKVRHTSLADFQAAVELALDRAELLATGQHLSDVTLLTVKQAAERSRQQTVALDPSLENPYAEGDPSYIAFQNNVLGNPVNRGYYQPHPGG